MPEIQTKDKLITLEELGVALNGKAGVTGVKGNAESSYRQGDVNLTPANLGAVAKAGDTMTGPLTIDMTTPRTVDDGDPEYAEIARFKRSAMQINDNVMLYLGKDFSDKNCGTILYHHAGNGSDSNYLALSAYNAAQSLRSYTDGHIELTQPLGVPYGGTGGNAMVYKGQKTASDSLNSINESGYWDCQINNLPSGIPSDAPNMNAIVINYYMPNIATNYQIYTVFQGGVSLRYERRFLGTWSSWRKVQYAT